MKTIFSIKKLYTPKWFILDATEQILGRLATKASKLLCGKEASYFTPGVDLGNFVIIINANKVQISGKKATQKLYYRATTRPGNLKSETFNSLKTRISTRIIEKAIYGMLPKGVIGRKYYRRLYVYNDNKVLMSLANGFKKLI